MNIDILHLTDSQHLGWDKFSDERAVLEAREARFLASCLQELGGALTDAWQFDRVKRVFWKPNDATTGAVIPTANPAHGAELAPEPGSRTD